MTKPKTKLSKYVMGWAIGIQNLSFLNLKNNNLKGPSASKYWKGKNPNVPEYSVVHKESVDSENFCPIRDAESTLY